MMRTVLCLHQCIYWGVPLQLVDMWGWTAGVLPWPQPACCSPNSGSWRIRRSAHVQLSSNALRLHLSLIALTFSRHLMLRQHVHRANYRLRLVGPTRLLYCGLNARPLSSSIYSRSNPPPLSRGPLVIGCGSNVVDIFFEVEALPQAGGKYYFRAPKDGSSGIEAGQVVGGKSI